MPSPDSSLPVLEALALGWDGTSPLDPRLKARLEQVDGKPGGEVGTLVQELRFLLIALGHANECPDMTGLMPGRPFRAGYRLTAAAGEPGQIDASFAHSLSCNIAVERRAEWFDHLWGVDLELWRHLRTADTKDLARRWLTSPGRRLVQSLEFLRILHGGSSDGPTDVRPERLAAASGADAVFADAPPGWVDLHAAIPGVSMRRWAPKDATRAVAVAFRRLEDGSPYSLRGAAIGWLLGRAMDASIYTIDEVHRDLREDLPVRLALALPTHDRPTEEVQESPAECFVARVEELLLQHAAHIARRGPPDDRVRGGWHIARWIHGCVTRSPFYRGDAERLHADLLSYLPDAPTLTDPADPLDPARFGADRLRIEDVALVAGVWAHYGPPGEHLPAPPPLASALRRLATRATNPAEHAAEAAYRRGESNQLGWDAPYFAPTWLARWLLTQWRVRWLADADDAALAECLRGLEEDDATLQWLAYVWQAEGAGLSAAGRHASLMGWRALRGAAQSARGPRMPPQALVSMALGLVDLLDADERAGVLAAIHDAPPEWRPFLLDAWAKAAQDIDDVPLATAARGTLVTLAGDPRLAAEIRRNAALMLVRRAVAARPTDEASLRDLAGLAAHPPLSDHPGLLRELRRLGVLTTSPRKYGR